MMYVNKALLCQYLMSLKEKIARRLLKKKRREKGSAFFFSPYLFLLLLFLGHWIKNPFQPQELLHGNDKLHIFPRDFCSSQEMPSPI